MELHEPDTRIDKADAKLDATQIKRKNEEDVKNDTKMKMVQYIVLVDILTHDEQ